MDRRVIDKVKSAGIKAPDDLPHTSTEKILEDPTVKELLDKVKFSAERIKKL